LYLRRMSRNKNKQMKHAASATTGIASGSTEVIVEGGKKEVSVSAVPTFTQIGMAGMIGMLGAAAAHIVAEAATAPAAPAAPAAVEAPAAAPEAVEAAPEAPATAPAEQTKTDETSTAAPAPTGFFGLIRGFFNSIGQAIHR
jgi:hypothetical protein